MSKAVLIVGGVVVVAGAAVVGVMLAGGEPDAGDAGLLPASTPTPPVVTEQPVVIEEAQPTRSLQDRDLPTGGWEDARRQWDEMRKQYDADGDGQLNEEERAALREAMIAETIAKHDKDGDGVLNEEEERAARWARMMNSPWGQRVVREYDANGDGVLNEAERAKYDADREAERQERLAAHIERFDTDGDGVLSEIEEEIAAETRRAEGAERRARQRERWDQMRARFDTDGDGRLSSEERLAARNLWRQASFVRQFDTTGDGVVDAADTPDFFDLVREGDLDADLNRDGHVDDVDIQLFTERVANGENVMPEELADVPELGGGRGGRPGGGGPGGGGGPRGG